MDDCSTLGTRSDLSETISIEIKPKCGFILNSGGKSCRFCLQQTLKVHRGRRNEVSRYCPMNFYSGDFQRFQSALAGLCQTPHNNLRIFNRGDQLFGESIPQCKRSVKLLDALKLININSAGEFSELLWYILYDKSSFNASPKGPVCQKNSSRCHTTNLQC